MLSVIMLSVMARYTISQIFLNVNNIVTCTIQAQKFPLLYVHFLELHGKKMFGSENARIDGFMAQKYYATSTRKTLTS
jgi:hypothetical protein